MTEEQFWASNPKKMKPYSEAKILWRKEVDEISYYMGIYTMNAFGVVLANAFSKKGTSKAEYYEKPIFDMAEDAEKNKITDDMSEEEKMKRVEQVFMMLGGQ